jgi:septum formation protein
MDRILHILILRSPFEKPAGCMLESQPRSNQIFFGGKLAHKTARLILASNSPRRKQLLALSGWIFRVLPADVDETPLEGEPVDEYVLRLAAVKARAVAPFAEDGELILAADTTVADQGVILGKPEDAQEAFQMLSALRGRVHQVHTAVAVHDPADGRLHTDLASTDVPMRAYTDDEIQAYIATGDPFDKAGSYAIQHPGFKPVDSLGGCYANVVGLPLCHLERLLKQFGVASQEDIPQACQKTLGYDCAEYEYIQNSPPGASHTSKVDAQLGAEGDL